MARESPSLHVRRSQRPGVANDAHRLGAARGLKASLTLPEVTGLPTDLRFRVIGRVLRNVNASGGRPVHT